MNMSEVCNPQFEADSKRRPGDNAIAARVARVKELGTDRGLRYILNGAAELLKNPLVLFYANGKYLESSISRETDDPIWNDFTKAGALSESSIRLFRDEGFFDELSNAKTIALLTSEKLKYDRMLGKLMSRDGILAAGLMLVACENPIEAGDPVVFEAVCGLCSREIRDAPELIDYGRRAQQAMIVMLLDNKELDKRMYSAHLADIYAGLDHKLFVTVLRPRGNPGEAALTELREQLRRIRPGLKYAVYNGEIVILLNSRDTTLDLKKERPKLARFLEQRGIPFGLSGGFENIYEIRRHYDDAKRAFSNP